MKRTHWFNRIALAALLLLALPAAVLAQDAAAIKKQISLENYDQARKDLAGFTAANPKLVSEGSFLQGMIAIKRALDTDLPADVRKKELENARTAFTEGLNKGRRDPFNYVGLGLLNLANGDAAGAKTNIEKGIAENDKDAFVLTEIGKAYLVVAVEKENKKLLEDGGLYLSKAELADANNVDLVVTLGNLYAQKNVTEMAVDKYKKATTLAPSMPQPYFAMGKLYLKEARKGNPKYTYGMALEQLKKAVEVDPNFAKGYLELQQVYFLAGVYAPEGPKKEEYINKSLEAGKKYLSMVGNSKFAKVRYAMANYFADNFDAALTTLNSVDTTAFDIERIRAYCVAETSTDPAALNKALDALNKIITGSPDLAITKDFKYLGTIYFKLGQVDKAVEYYNKVIEKDPAQITLYKELYTLFEKNKDWENAVKFRKIYVEKVTDKSSVKDDWFLLGWTYYARLKQYDKAVAEFSALLATYPETPLPYYFRATCHVYLDNQKLGDEAKMAKDDYLKFIELGNATTNPKEFKSSYSFLASYYYTSAEKNGPLSYKYANKVLAEDPENKQAKPIADYWKGQKVTPAE